MLLEPLIRITPLRVERAPDFLAPGGQLELRADPEGAVLVLASRPKRWFIPARAPTRIGRLEGEAAALLLPRLLAREPFRVRIVELVPAHLSPDRRARISISVWGRR